MSSKKKHGGSKASSSTSAQGAAQTEFLFRVTLSNTIFDVCYNRPGWRETTSESDWDFNFTDVKWVHDFLGNHHMSDQMRINHFHNHYELTRKDLLTKNVKKFKRHLEKKANYAEAAEYDFVPTSFVLPQEYALFCEYFKKYPGDMWIMKPVGRAQGKGIFLVNKLSQVSEWKPGAKWKSTSTDGPDAESAPETYVVQKYVADPMTVGGKKFDMRIYVLVTSWSPLEVWLHRDGFCRFSTARYSSRKEDMSKTHMHLTNNAIQKKEDDYGSSGMGDCKWPLLPLRLDVARKFGKDAADSCFLAIQQILLRSLFACQQVMIQDKHCFELYGFDIMLDEDLRPWMLESNASPSLSASDDSDYATKCGILHDMLNVLDLEGRRSGKEVQVGGFDLIWKAGPCPRTQHRSFLGSTNDQRTPIDKICKLRRARAATREKAAAAAAATETETAVTGL